MLLLFKLFRVERFNMTNNTFCIYHTDYNNTILGDKMYHLIDSAFFFVFHLTHKLFLYKNVNLEHI